MTYDPELRRRTPLAIRLAADIAGGGPMPIDAFMTRCLWDPEHGYYSTRQPIGGSGDFITAPQISQVFGELIGLWAAVIWRDLMQAPARFTLAELGPGNGTLMADALRATARVPGFHAATRLSLIEASATLCERQRQALADRKLPATWTWDAREIEPPAIVVANEFFDALPVRQWISTGAAWQERGVGLDGDGRLCFVAGAERGRGPSATDHWPQASAGTIREELADPHPLAALAGIADRGPLAAIVIDYGHERSAAGDTLQAVRAHAHEHPLTSPGEADLSTQVDFEALAKMARAAGLAVDGPISQAEFLGRLGIVERASRLMSANPARALDIEQAVGRLIAPSGMGSRFKALGLRSAGLPVLPGFETQGTEQRRR